MPKFIKSTNSKRQSKRVRGLPPRKPVLKTTCSICLITKTSENHCDTCRGEDKRVCRSCIVKMLTLCGCENAEAHYQCPHCRTERLTQCWFTTNIKAQQKINSLLRERLAAVQPESEDEDDEQEPIFRAIRNHNIAMVQQLLEQDESLVNYISNEVNDQVDHVLHFATVYGNKEMQLYLFSKQQADVNSICFHRTLLHWGDLTPEAMELLLGRSDMTAATINHQCSSGITPLMQHAFNGNARLVRLLLNDARTDLSLQDGDGNTALDYAIQHGHTDIADMIRAKSAGR